MQLYGFFRSSAAFRLRIALNLKGLPYETVPVHLRRGEQRGQAYLAVNPQGLVPALVDGDRVMIQSLATVEWLDEAHPNIPLLPNTADGRQRVRALAQIVACDIHPLGNTRVLQYLTGRLGHDESVVRDWFNHWIQLGFEAYEALVARHPDTGRFSHGDQPGLADVCLVPQVFNARRYDLDLAPYPTVTRIFDACMAMPAFQRAQPASQPDAE